MLKPIPSALLTDTLTLHVCTGLDVWQNPSSDQYIVRNVHLQATNEVKRTRENTEVVLRSILFIDGALSTPVLDFDALALLSQRNGAPLTCTVTTASGATATYTVATVDAVPDVPATRTHHYELGLV